MKGIVTKKKNDLMHNNVIIIYHTVFNLMRTITKHTWFKADATVYIANHTITCK